MPRLIDADALTSILEEWEEKACDGTENDGSDGTTRVLHPVPTTTREMIDLIADQPTIPDKTEDFMLALATLTEHHAKEKLEWLKMIKDVAECCDQWIPATERVPMKEEYLAKAKDGEEYMARLLIAYQSDTVGYAIGYYDGFKWLDEMSMRRITDVIAWKPFFPLLEQPGADLP